jgi:hypothetical protein
MPWLALAAPRHGATNDWLVLLGDHGQEGDEDRQMFVVSSGVPGISRDIELLVHERRNDVLVIRVHRLGK